MPPEKWDAFHELIVTDELSRAGSGGLVWNLIGGLGIGGPPLAKFGSKALKERILPGLLAGETRICLAITEPDAGSDVANLTCEAKLTEDGKHYIVNGEKKWITNGIWADYFTAAVRTGGEGAGGVSLLLIERAWGREYAADGLPGRMEQRHDVRDVRGHEGAGRELARQGEQGLPRFVSLYFPLRKRSSTY